MKSEPKQFGSLKGTLYTLEGVGDSLPMHTHNEETVHVTFVLEGSVRVHGDGWDMVVKTGNFIDWVPGQAHEFVALEPTCRFLNIIKGVADGN